MKKKISFVILIALIAAGNLSAQGKWSFGVVGSRFDNLNDKKLTEVENPIGYGIMAAYSFNKEFSIAVTGEYFNENLDNNRGKEKNFRGHVSAFLSPFNVDFIRPYFSVGFVYTSRQIKFTGKGEESKDLFNARFGAGLDFPLTEALAFNFDLGFYNDGLNVTGWSSSLGLRFSPNF